MKSLILTLCGALLTATLLTAQINTPSPSPTCEFKQSVGLTDVTLNYSRPGVKDRAIFAADGLVPFGQIWRTGANSATTIEFSKDVMFPGKKVEAGKYAIYTIPGKDEWTVMLYSDLTLGGNVGNYDEANEVYRTTAKVHTMEGQVETFAIDIQNIRDASASLDFYWESTWVSVPFEVFTHDQVMEQINGFADNPMSDVAGNYLNSGWYLYTSGHDLDKAAEYMKKGCEYTTSPFKYFWMSRASETIAATGDYAGAIAMAKSAHEAGQNAPENAKGFYEDTVKSQIDNNIEKWSKM